ncbi:hypothetical protein OEZ85_011875 [Tetradesmus obliquus]|uniref:Arogenate dehydratase n=2 Tax=Tetradesmus obliquus TaxID=3088 RepID=A0ABY8TRN0_TETOB|nr:hypothetical protein OEZ85_011875 [Tetradesmus obliquus]
MGIDGMLRTSVNPVVAFGSSLGRNTSLPDRLYRQYMANFVLCPAYTSQGTCINGTGPVMCAWNPRRQRCEADKYASFLMPMVCPGSAAHTYLNCMRKPSEAACKADDACTAEHAHACLPRTMVAQAKAINSSVQAMAERLALGVLKGSRNTVGDCAEARTLQRMAQLCPFQNPWNRCNHKYCTYDVPPYLPRRPQDNGKPANAAANAAAAAAAPNTADALSYYGYNPGPVCAIDTDKLPAVMHEVLGVSKALASVVVEAQKACKATESVWFNITANVAACGSSRSRQQARQQTCAAQRSQSDLRSSLPLGSMSQRQPQQLVPGMQPAVLTMDSLLRAAEQTVPQGAGEASKFRYRAAYQGVPGAYSEMAACKACPDAEPVPCEQFEVAFQALSQWTTDWAVLPIENSLGGSIHAVYDLLLRYRLHIVGETSIAVNHCLLALPGTKLSDLTRVLSHPQALAQTDTYLRKLGVVKEAVDDTAGAAQMVARQQLQGVGAVASRRAAELYGLDILDEDIQDAKDNVTRFIKLARDPLLSREGEGEATPFKTSIVFSLKEGPGQLFKALSVFALRDIDMTKIESRPMRTNPIVLTKPEGAAQAGKQRFNYLFYIDFVGALSDPVCQNALRHLQESAPFMRVLGSYPMELQLGGLDSNTPFDSINEH